MVTKLKPLMVQKILLDNNIKLFDPLEFQRVFGVSYQTARKFLFRYSKKDKDIILKLRNGLYALSDNLPNEYSIANRLYQPSYVSFDTALSYHHIIPETIYTITSATPKLTREFEVLDKVFKYYKIKEEAFRGYEPRKIDNLTVLIAEPEKALVDYLYFISLGKKRLSERLATKNLNKKKVLAYAKAFKRERLVALAKEVL